jgi:uncharacterized membrane protein YkvA (DUF1232 family)
VSDRIASIIGDQDARRLVDLMRRLPGYLRLVRQIIIDPAVPTKSKAYLGMGGVYAISPVDLVPGIIPVAGQLDDAYVLLIGLKKSLETMPPEVAERHMSSAGLTIQHIDEDLALVISIAKRLARLVIATGVKFGRAGKATFRFAREKFGEWK